MCENFSFFRVDLHRMSFKICRGQTQIRAEFEKRFRSTEWKRQKAFQQKLSIKNCFFFLFRRFTFQLVHKHTQKVC